MTAGRGQLERPLGLILPAHVPEIDTVTAGLCQELLPANGQRLDGPAAGRGAHRPGS